MMKYTLSILLVFLFSACLENPDEDSEKEETTNPTIPEVLIGKFRTDLTDPVDPDWGEDQIEEFTFRDDGTVTYYEEYVSWDADLAEWITEEYYTTPGVYQVEGNYIRIALWDAGEQDSLRGQFKFWFKDQTLYLAYTYTYEGTADTPVGTWVLTSEVSTACASTSTGELPSACGEPDQTTLTVNADNTYMIARDYGDGDIEEETGTYTLQGIHIALVPDDSEDDEAFEWEITEGRLYLASLLDYTLLERVGGQ